MKIRDDLVGVVIATTSDGTTVTLNAGDEVPEGVVVGDHLTAAEVKSKPPRRR